MHVLHLQRTAAGQLVIQMLPRAAERLPGPLRFGTQSIPLRPAGLREQALIKLVAIFGNVRQQRGQRNVGAVRAGSAAGGARGHQNRTRQNGRRFKYQLLARARRTLGRRDARQQRVERDLLQHETPVVAAIVDQLLVPLAEVVVRPFAGRVIKLVRPRVERQLVQHFRIEPSLLPDLGIRGGENRHRPRDQFLIWPVGHADALDVEWNRPHAFVRIRLDLPRFEHRDGPVADVVVERFERAGDNPLRFVPRPALGQDRFERTAQENRAPQLGVCLVPQQVAVKLPISGKQMQHEQPNHRPSLAHVAKRSALKFELVHPPDEPIRQHRDRVALVGAPLLDAGKQRVEVAEKGGIARATGEIQIADHLLQETQVARVGLEVDAAHLDAAVPGIDTMTMRIVTRRRCCSSARTANHTMRACRSLFCPLNDVVSM